MKYVEAKKVRDKFFRPFIARNLEGEKPLIIDAVPVEEHLQYSFMNFVNSENIQIEAMQLGIFTDDRAYGAMGFAKFDDDFTIMLRFYNPEKNKTETMLAKEYEQIEDLVTKDILSKL